MDRLLAQLTPGSLVLDLGAGGGSFGYQTTQGRVVAVDVDFPASAQPCWGRLKAVSQSLPLVNRSFDAVVCNHTLEHFEQPEKCVAEIDRILKEDGSLWVAVPDCRGLDDRLYRFLFTGPSRSGGRLEAGGHVNQFTLESLIDIVETGTDLRAIRYKKLFTGFVYLNPPDPQKLIYFSRRAALLGSFPPHLLRWVVRWLNFGVRCWDQVLGGRASQYGWGVVFKKSPGLSRTRSLRDLERMRADVNVCYRCGAGHPLETILNRARRRVFWTTYACPVCSEPNVLFRGGRLG